MRSPAFAKSLIIEPGLLPLPEDLRGRPGYRRWGLPMPLRRVEQTRLPLRPR